MAEEKAITPRDLGVPGTIPLPSRRDWRIGIIGFGSVARIAHMPSYRQAGWSVTAVADPSSEARRAAKEEFGVPHAYSDFRELITDPDVEIIDLCTHPDIREDVVRLAADAGKHVITEKPLGESMEECERMVEIAEREGIRFAVHQNYRWYRMPFYAYHIVRAGFIGEPFFASIEILGRQDVTIAGNEFCRTCDNFLTVQWNNHLADLLRYWTGKDARRVLTRTGRMGGQNFASDNLLISIHDFGEGLTGHILHHELLRSSEDVFQCRIDGDKGSLVFDMWDNLRLESKLLGEGFRTLDVSGIDFPLSWCGTMGDFLMAIEQGREPLVSARRNLETIRTVLAEDASAKSGGTWVELT